MKFKKLIYSETIYPKEKNTGLRKTRTRSNYAEQPNYESNGVYRGPLDRRTFWRRGIDDRNLRSGSVIDNLESRGVYDSNVGSYVPGSYLINSLGYKDGYATSVWGMGSLKDFHNSASVNIGDFGELNKVNYDSWIDTFTTSSYDNNGVLEERSRWHDDPTASISFCYPGGFWTNDADAYTRNAGSQQTDASLEMGTYKDYGLFWQTSDERARLLGERRFPAYDSYEKFSENIKLFGKDCSVLPEFTISDHIDYYIENTFESRNRKFLSLKGAHNTSSADSEDDDRHPFRQDFFDEFIDSDFSFNFMEIANEHSQRFENVKVNRIKLKCKGIKKLLPYNGFYPMNRTVQLASIFSSSINPPQNIELSQWRNDTLSASSDAEKANAGRGWELKDPQSDEFFRLMAVMQPLFAPGIVYNTIKSGIAVSWTAMTGAVIGQQQIDRSWWSPYGKGIGHSTIAGTRAWQVSTSPDNTWRSTTGSTFRIPFECLYNFNGSNFPISKSSVDEPISNGQGDWVNGDNMRGKQGHVIGPIYPELLRGNQHFVGGFGNESAYLNKTFCFGWNGEIAPQFEMAMGNFLAESVRFFLQDQNLSAIFSDREENIRGNFENGKSYYMDLALEKTPDLVMCESYWNKNNKYFLSGAMASSSHFQNFSCSFDGRYFGPATNKYWYHHPIQQGASGTAAHPDAFQGGYYMRDDAGAHYMHADPAQAPFTPPYFYGTSIARIRYDSDGTENTSNSVIASILAKSDVIDINRELLEKIQEGDFTSFESSILDLNNDFASSSMAYRDRMVVGDSLKIFGLSRENIPSYDKFGNTVNVTPPSDSSKDRWVIAPKFECPVLDFSTQPLSRITISGGMHPSQSLSRSISASPSEAYLSTSSIGTGRGMWSGYGLIPKNGSGIKFELRESFTAADAPPNAKSLIKAMGFDKTKSQKFVGKIAREKEISEAVICIPFTRKPSAETEADTVQIIDDRFFFKVDKEIMQNQINEGKKTTITRLVEGMKQYVIPPNLDFVLNQNIFPFVMYLFEFKHLLNQRDLQDIWQGILPDIGMTAEIDEESISHKFTKDEFFHGKKLPEDIRWMVFKVKKKAEIDYSKVTFDISDDPAFSKDLYTAGQKPKKYSYNWPYDFFSLVELAKVDTEFELVIEEGSDEVS